MVKDASFRPYLNVKKKHRPGKIIPPLRKGTLTSEKRDDWWPTRTKGRLKEKKSNCEDTIKKENLKM